MEYLILFLNDHFYFYIEPVPVVLLVVEGGPNTVRTGIKKYYLISKCFLFIVHEAVVENSIPAVFLEGTGRCCDLFAKAVHIYNEYQQSLEIGDEAPPK